MARGWESKSIEAQQESAQTDGAKGKRPIDEKEKAVRREAEQLRLSQAYLRQQIESSTHERYSETLRRALSEVEEKLRRLEERN
ncbi:MAG TPA: hypothetical protein VHN74_04565 [Candidatus Angelobacter sp.]|jgi:hypothetical protein|nr:hypothetical protein [Candidatus Angelobacter sp.]